MPHDLYGNPLKVGDLAVIPVVIESVSQTEDACNVTVKVSLKPQGSEHFPVVTLNAKQMVRTGGTNPPDGIPVAYSLAPHAKDYKPEAYKQYTLDELGHWVHLLAKRATHRDNPEKAKKDLTDAINYYIMMGDQLLELKKQLVL